MITEIYGKVQNYDWGVVDGGMVHRMVSSNKKLPVNQKYAEYWMGTHPSGCSTLPDKSLLSNITDLPFLFKVLSVDKALSIQAHPDKQLAQQLHKTDPSHYKDSNHKPEMCIAISNEFEALSGFCTEAKFNDNCLQIPEIKSVIKSGSFKEQFTNLMNASSEQIKWVVDSLENKPSSSLISLIKTLNSAYPLDVGVLCPIFMNHVKLSKYQALFMAANEPHAYLKGDCVECMANSDNVVRAGLTPKFRDLDNLINMLTYKRYSISDLIVKPSRNGVIWKYESPVQEFDVYKIELKSNEQGN
eukprot:NODE_736_length_4706_cov_0.180161.p2 type:complete len:301 gc:universal NODE_736_length_4706_cov_0.180161:3314-4216(+)